MSEQPENAAAPDESAPVDEPAAVGTDVPAAGAPDPADGPPTEVQAPELGAEPVAADPDRGTEPRRSRRRPPSLKRLTRPPAEPATG